MLERMNFKKNLEGFKKRFFNLYYFTCTCSDKKIRVYSERQLWKFEYCPFCGMKINWDEKWK